ncbi:MAG: hypothetical protein Q8R20_02740 [Nanoarchaeota archaeon]|nr:hypothetical protein [Nanoarchaeota archaeon]
MDEKKFQELIKKVEAMKSSGTVDLSMEEDLSIAVMNLISLEEHFFMTGEKTGKESYFDTLGEIREVRKALLARMIPKHEGETWCVSKHLLATTMRLIEVGTKLQGDGEKEKAKETFDYAWKLYSIFWGLRLNLIELPDAKEMAEEEQALRQAQGKPWTLKDIMEKMVDCCDE